METKLLFIQCKHYDFVDENGEQHQGFSCKAFEPTSKSIVKVKTDKPINQDFGSGLKCNVELNGNYVTYSAIN